jgi:hypothetical protein
MLNAIDDGSCYGRVATQGKRKGKLSQDERHASAACEESHGTRPSGYVCRHLCVNDSSSKKRGEDGFVCVNPEHIEWNTRKQNVQDAIHNMSKVKKGNTHGKGNKGKKLSAKHRKAMSDAAKRRVKTADSCAVPTRMLE